MKKFFFLICILFRSTVLSDNPILTLDEAYQRILNCSPVLVTASKDLTILYGEKRQVGLYPNPVISIVGNNIGEGSRNSNANEIFLGLAQPIELGGKRSARVEVANAEACIAFWQREIIKRDLYDQLVHAFIEAAYLKERLCIAVDLCKLAEEHAHCVTLKIANGKIQLLEEKRAELQLKKSQLFLQKMQSQLNSLKNSLASMWCGSVDFKDIEYPFFELICLPTQTEMCNLIKNTPEYEKLLSEVAHAKLLMKLEEANSIPDVVVNAGITLYEQDGKNPVTVGFDIPVPIFNQNQGNRQRAAVEYSKTKARIFEYECTMNTKLKSLIDSYEVSHIETQILQENLLSIAEAACTLEQERYEYGKIDYQALLETKKVFYDIKLEYLDAVKNCLIKMAEINRIIGREENDE